MVFWIVFLLLVILFVLSTSVHITKTIKWASWFSPKQGHYVQLFIILVLCVMTGLQYVGSRKEGLENNSSPSPTPSPAPTPAARAPTPAPAPNDITNVAPAPAPSDITNVAPAPAPARALTPAPAPSDDSESSHNSPSTSDDSSFDKFGSAIYNKANALIYKGGSYIPSYSDFMLANNIPMHPKEINDKIVKNVGFCEYYQALPEEIENQCNNSDLNACASINCCTLLKGEKGVKCVAGNEYGPINKNNYNNPMIGTLNEYYHKGKCYGNCPPS